MNYSSLSNENKQQAERILGFLNFSTGSFDPKFYRDFDDFFFDLDALNQEESIAERREDLSCESEMAPGQKETVTVCLNSKPEAPSGAEPTYQTVRRILLEALDDLTTCSDAFKNGDQARGVLEFVYEHLLPAYKEFHADLLYHKSDVELFTSFFIAQCCQYALEAESPWDDFKQADILQQLNDYIGYRPVAVLHSHQKMQPYSHEYFHPQTLYLEGAGLWKGPYYEVVCLALNILRNTDEQILLKAMFDPDELQELALDIRTLDFEHPVNRRLNYPFGSWDMESVDNKGFYRRFVVHQTTLDAICGRIESGEIPRDEATYEAASVLAGTMLMGSCVTGGCPDSHDSNVTLSTLLPHVAAYRDEFYESLLEKTPEPIKSRLKEEVKQYRQPFGAARQSFNHRLSRLRADQLQNVLLARLYAWMGYTDEAQRRVSMVKCAAARIRCRMECLLTNCHVLLDEERMEEAIPLAPQIFDLLKTGIECGALIDPWNMLGFGGQFPLFTAAEDATPDHRVDELINLIGAIFNLYSRFLKESAAAGREDLVPDMKNHMKQLAEWWDKFASTEVSGIDGISGDESWKSAAMVADALYAWQKAGTAAGDIKFWRPRVAEFDSTKAYALLIEALLDQRDPVASMALLMNWLSSSEEILLDDGDYSFHPLVLRWMEETWYKTSKQDRLHGRRGQEKIDGWDKAKKFLDFFEANAGEYWEIPSLELERDNYKTLEDFKNNYDSRSSKGKKGPNKRKPGRGNSYRQDDALGNISDDDLFQSDFDMDMPNEYQDEYNDNDSDENLFASAYENVVYHDTTDDGIDGDMMDGMQPDPLSDFELTDEVDRISDRLLFWVTVARLWKMTAVFSIHFAQDHEERDETLAAWRKEGLRKLHDMEQLSASIEEYKIPDPQGNRQSMIEYEQKRGMKDMLLERIIATTTEIQDACHLLSAAQQKPLTPDRNDWENLSDVILQALIHGNKELVTELWKSYLRIMGRQTLLYLPLSRGGKPLQIAQSKGIQIIIQRLLNSLPKAALMDEAFDLLYLSQKMEREHPVGIGAITRFDKIFEVGCQGMVRAIIQSSVARRRWSTMSLTMILDKLVEPLLMCWLAHSSGIRVSSMEAIGPQSQWNRLQTFIQNYGNDLFSPVYMGYGNLQAILHQGVRVWIRRLQSEEEPEQGQKLLEDLNVKISYNEAVHWLEIIFEAILEYYGQYIDYNSTTTQSDKGEMLYTLLDFLRLLANYDRIAWHLQPVGIVHATLVREGKMEAAAYWLQAVCRRCASAADAQGEKYQQLQKKHGMIMSGIGDRLQERFTRPLEVNQLCSLIKPAIEERRNKQSADSFTLFVEGVEKFTEIPLGNGYEPPAWLDAVEKEAQRIRNVSEEEDEMLDLSEYVPHTYQTQEKLVEISGRLKRRMEAGDYFE